MIEEAKKRLSAFVAIQMKQLEENIHFRAIYVKTIIKNTKDYNMRIEAIEAEIEKELLLAKEEGRQEVLKEGYEECSDCDLRKPDVSHRTNNYAAEIENDPDAMHTVCDDCDYENTMDI